MSPILRTTAILLLAAVAWPSLGADANNPAGSSPGAHMRSNHDDYEDDHDHHDDASSRVTIPPSVRSNLGITFVKVEHRWVEQTLRVPGRFEHLPSARREYRAPLPGRVEILVEQFQRVEVGAPLYRMHSPAWRSMQQQIADAESQTRRLTARMDIYGPLLAAHQQHEESLHDSVAIWKERVEQLRSIREAGGGRVDEFAQARASLAAVRTDLASVLEKKAALHAERLETEADLHSAHTRMDFLLDSASTILILDRATIEERIRTDQGEKPRWATIDQIEVVASDTGVVESLGVTNGAWIDERIPVLTVVQPDRLRFRATALQSDLGALRDGLPARVAPPSPTAAGRAVALGDTMDGDLTLGLSGNPNERTIDLYVTPAKIRPWARPGVFAQLEIVTDPGASQELAIPLAAVQWDGLIPVIFRRVASDADVVVRVEATLGPDDGRWVVLRSGAHEGDEIVLDGAFQLMLATSGTILKGGHFHSDGAFHEGGH